MRKINLIGLFVFIIGSVFSSCDIENVLEPEIKNEAPQSFELKSPTDESEMVHARDVSLYWNDAVDSDGSIRSYYIYIGTESNPQLIDSVSRSSYSLDSLKAETTYYWQIEAIDDDGASVRSAVQSFSTDDPNAFPFPIYPAEGDVDISIPISFEWGCRNAIIDGCELYITEVGTSGDYIMMPDNTPYTDLKPNTTYLWWIIGVNTLSDYNNEGYYWRGGGAEFTTK